MVISAVARVVQITEGTLQFTVLLVIPHNLQPTLPAYREIQTLSAEGAHLEIQNSHCLTKWRKQGSVLWLHEFVSKECHPPRVPHTGASDAALLQKSDLSPELRFSAHFHCEHLVLRSSSRSSLLTAGLVLPVPRGARLSLKEEEMGHLPPRQPIWGDNLCSTGSVLCSLTTTFKRETHRPVQLQNKPCSSFTEAKVLTNTALSHQGRHVSTKMYI